MECRRERREREERTERRNEKGEDRVKERRRRCMKEVKGRLYKEGWREETREERKKRGREDEWSAGGRQETWIWKEEVRKR